MGCPLMLLWLWLSRYSPFPANQGIKGDVSSALAEPGATEAPWDRLAPRLIAGALLCSWRGAEPESVSGCTDSRHVREESW
jgi:hypothetical protein